MPTTNICASDPVDLQSKLNRELVKLQTRLQANKLSLNVKKTKYSFTGSQNKLLNLNHQFDVKIDEHSLERAKTYKYLSILIWMRAYRGTSTLTTLSKKHLPVHPH